MNREDMNKPVTEERIIDECKILFDAAHSSKHSFCCFSAPDAWLPYIYELCKDLEALNKSFYSTDRAFIRAAQIKEKFGTLRFYFDVLRDPPLLVRAYEKAVTWVFDKIDKLDFKLESVIVHDMYQTATLDECPDDLESSIQRDKCIGNVRHFTLDGVHFRERIDDHYRRAIEVPHKHKLLYELKRWRCTATYALRRLYETVSSKVFHRRNDVCMHLESAADALVQATTQKLECICMHCGARIGQYEKSPRCITRGWVSYLCRECADKDGGEYRIGNEVWQAGKLLEKLENADLST